MKSPLPCLWNKYFSTGRLSNLELVLALATVLSFFTSCSWNKKADFCGPGHFYSQLPYTLGFRQCFLQNIDFLLFKLLIFSYPCWLKEKHNKKSPKPLLFIIHYLFISYPTPFTWGYFLDHLLVVPFINPRKKESCWANDQLRLMLVSQTLTFDQQ